MDLFLIVALKVYFKCKATKWKHNPNWKIYVPISVFRNKMRGQLDFEVKRFPGGSRKLLFINGFGGNCDQPGIQWWLNRLKEHDLDITCIQQPTFFKDFDEDVLKRCQDIQEAMDDHVAVGFSFGGLTLSFLSKARRRIFIAPFWAINERWLTPGHEQLLKLLKVITVPVLKRQFEKEDAGPLAVEEDIYGIPDRISFRTIDQFVQTHKRLPDPRSSDHVFYSHQDKIVSPSTIQERIDAFGLTSATYYGGHMFYLTRGRNELVSSILSEIDRGFD